MAKKRFTFKDAKEKIATLEAELKAFKDAAVEDVKEDTKKIGFGDVLFFVAGVVITLLVQAVF